MGYQQAAIAWLFLVQVSADDAHRGIAAAGWRSKLLTSFGWDFRIARDTIGITW